MEQIFSEESDEGGGVDETAPAKPTRGPDLDFPLQRKDIDLLIEAFRKKKVCKRFGSFRFLGFRVLDPILAIYPNDWLLLDLCFFCEYFVPGALCGRDKNPSSPHIDVVKADDRVTAEDGQQHPPE